MVGTSRTDPAVLEALYGWMETLGKAPVAVRRDVPGFVANRLQYALLREAWALVEAGVCSYADLDRVLTRGLGARWAAIGPFQTVDLAGLDIHLAVAENLFPELANEREAPRLLAETVADGALGTKSGRGLLGTYGPEDRTRLVARRDRMLRAVARLHREGDEPAAPE